MSFRHGNFLRKKYNVHMLLIPARIMRIRTTVWDPIVQVFLSSSIRMPHELTLFWNQIRKRMSHITRFKRPFSRKRKLKEFSSQNLTKFGWPEFKVRCEKMWNAHIPKMFLRKGKLEKKLN
jgi:hypothetical protein